MIGAHMLHSKFHVGQMTRNQESHRQTIFSHERLPIVPDEGVKAG